jgi:hypothetical protein
MRNYSLLFKRFYECSRALRKEQPATLAHNMNVTKATCFPFSLHIAFNYELLTYEKNLLNVLNKQQGCTEGQVPQDISASTTQ